MGGAVNVIALGTRQTTYDIDYFTLHKDDASVRLLEYAASIVYENDETVIPEDWINDEISFWSDTPIPYENGISFDEFLVQESEKQKTTLFQAPGLRVLAAPWIHALTGKLDRLVFSAINPGFHEAKRWPYDTEDAADYLHQYLQCCDAEGVDPTDKTITECSLNHLYRHYQPFAPVFEVPRSVLESVNVAYKERYGREPIILDSSEDTGVDDSADVDVDVVYGSEVMPGNNTKSDRCPKTDTLAERYQFIHIY